MWTKCGCRLVLQLGLDSLAPALDGTVGVVEHGLFLGMAITFSAMALLRPIPRTSPGDDPLPDDGCTSEGAAGSLTGH